MTMTDPVADMLTRLRNANSAHHDSVSLPSSKLKTHIAEILQQEGYIAGWEISDARVGQTLTLTLKYGPNRERSIAGIKRVSKPGLRVYAKSTEIPTVLGGLGVAILSTSSGFSPTARPSRRAWAGKSSPTCGDLTCRVLDVSHRHPRRRDHRVDGQDVAVKGPKGELALTVANPIEVKVEEGQVVVTRPTTSAHRVRCTA